MTIEEMHEYENWLEDHLEKVHGYKPTQIFSSTWIACETLESIHLELHQKERVC